MAKSSSVVKALTPQPDLIDHPPHYQGANGVECIEAQSAAADFCELSGFEIHLKLTAMGYIFRCGKKGLEREKHLEDARKARWYVNALIEHLEKEGA